MLWRSAAATPSNACRSGAKAMQPLLPLVERLSLYPAETLLAVPLPPDQALRGVLVLQGLSRQLEIETEALRRDQSEMNDAADALAQELPKLSQAEATQKQQSDALDKQIAAAHAEQAGAEEQARQAASEAAAAAARTDTLRAALTALEAQRRTDEATAKQEAIQAERQKRATAVQAARDRQAMAARPSRAGSIPANAAPQGQLQPPVIGVVVKGWGEATDAGPATGVLYHAPPGAHVISPCSGRVVFAASFRSYGLLMIIDCRRRLPCRAIRFRSAGRAVGSEPSGGRTGRHHAELGAGHRRAPAWAVC